MGDIENIYKRPELLEVEITLAKIDPNDTCQTWVCI